MFRTSTCRVERWSDKTMSVMREQQLEACQDRLYRCPATGIFDELCEDEVKSLYLFSFYAREGGHKTPCQTELREKVLRGLPLEACYLSPGEDDLIKRMLRGGGEAFLDDWNEISAAEALISRLWCSLQILEDEYARLVIAPELIEPITKALMSAQYPRIREQLFTFDATLHSLLYLSGFLHASVPLSQFPLQKHKDADGASFRLIGRYLRAAFDYTETPEGEMLLLHPGLADPEHLLSNLAKQPPMEIQLTREMMLGGMNGMLPEEVASSEAMRGELFGAVRPEYDEEEVLDDLRMMAKQGASFTEMREVLESMLCVLPTPRMLNTLRLLHQQTVRWIGMTPAVIN